MINKIQVIAEVKTKSPYGFSSEKTWEELFDIANDIGDIISVHTDARWGGSFDLIERAKKMTSKPILAKGLHYDDSEITRAYEAGADYILAVGRVPDIYKEKCLIEPLLLRDMQKIPHDSKIVWNSRDLYTGKPKKETFEQAREIWKGWLCQASYIKTTSDIKPGADAVLVGKHLEEFSMHLKRLEKGYYL